MFARRPIVLGGLIAPVLWSGLLYTILDFLNPLLASHIDWPWFIASQVAFGIVAGLVVVRQSPVPTSRTCHSPCARESKLRESFHHEKRRGAAVNRFRYLCASAALSLLLSGLQFSAWPAPKGFRNRGPESNFGLRHSLRAKLRGLPWRGRTRRSSDCACRSCLSRHRGRSVDAQSHRQRRTRNLHAGFCPELRWNADGQTDRCDYERNIFALGQAREFSTEAIHLPMRQKRQAMPAWRSRVRNLLRILPRP